MGKETNSLLYLYLNYRELDCSPWICIGTGTSSRLGGYALGFALAAVGEYATSFTGSGTGEDVE